MKERAMASVIRGRAWVFGDGVSTDHIIPGRYFHLRGDLPALAEHALEDADPAFARDAQAGDFVVAGSNFGQGSSREYAALVLKERRVPVILAPSFARIFFRNAINVGLLPIICDTEGFQAGDEIEVDLDGGMVTNLSRGIERQCPPLPPVMQSIMGDGGLVPHLLKHGGYKWENTP
jgi:3-isopropylmalate/(R)-2-methylmalate dehydratase small subunit